MTLLDQGTRDRPDTRGAWRDASPIHVVRTPREEGSAAEALRETHRDLARAEQNLLDLVKRVGGASARKPRLPPR